jgi:hypothetical protein
MDYRLAFGQLDTIKSGQTQVVLKQKMEKKIPSLEGLGVGCAIIGKHPNRWFIDDVFDRPKANSDTQTHNIKEWFRSDLIPCLGKEQRVVVVGTRWRFNDLYGDLIKGGKFKVILVEAIGTDRTELGRSYLNQSYWPKIWSLDALQKETGSRDLRLAKPIPE